MNAAIAKISDELAGKLLCPDLMLPEQFYAKRSLAENGGERALQWAVLSNGIENYLRLAPLSSRNARRELAELRCWVGRNDWRFLYSFVNLCSTFELDADAVRRALVRYEQRTEPLSRPRRFRHAA